MAGELAVKDGFVLFDQLPERVEEIYLNQILLTQQAALDKSISVFKDEGEIEVYSRSGQEMLRRLFTKENVKVLVVYREGDPVGFMTAVIRDQDVSLYGLQVIKFGEGIATSIIDYAKVAFSKKRLYGLVHKDNKTAVRYFESIGCEIFNYCVHPEDHIEFPPEKNYVSIGYPKSGSLEDEQLKITEKVSRHVCTEIYADSEVPRGPLSQHFAVALKNSFWNKGQTLTVSLFGSNRNSILNIRKKKIKKALAKSWESCCAIRFKFLDHNDESALIRITFIAAQGSWSYVGKAIETIDKSQPTMNLGWIDEHEDDNDGTIQHEFGHTLGLAHEHQSPLSTIAWTDDIYSYYKYNYGWTHDKVDQQIKNRLPKDQVEITDNQYDKRSIMHYDFSKAVAGEDYHRNVVLSENDKKFARERYGVNREPEPAASINSNILSMLAGLVHQVEAIGSQVGSISGKVDNIGDRVERLEKKR